MSPAIGSSLGIVIYMALFAATGIAFLFVNLLVGMLLRPHDPHPEKREIYECGEPTIGSSYVQFDLRFYVVALLFLIFDVEVAFFFPWATVFGKATHLKDPAIRDNPAAIASIYDEMGVPRADQPTDPATVARSAQQLTWFSFLDILVFFGVILVGFAYVWMRGDIDWVRAVSRERAGPAVSTTRRRLP